LVYGSPAGNNGIVSPLGVHFARVPIEFLFYHHDVWKYLALNNKHFLTFGDSYIFETFLEVRVSVKSSGGGRSGLDMPR